MRRPHTSRLLDAYLLCFAAVACAQAVPKLVAGTQQSSMEKYGN
jgi:hypothetical protein